jgi:PAS domain S-box-containing protein
MHGSFLIVDDEQSLRTSFVSFLTNAGYQAMAAGSYHEALELLELQHSFDVVFSDIMLGKKTGIDLLKELRSRGFNAPVVMVTGFPQTDTAVESVRLGAFDYMPKPVTKEMLLKTAKTALEYKRLHDENESYRAHLEGILKSVDDAIMTYDREGCLASFNPAAGELCGLKDDDLHASIREIAALSNPAIQTLVSSTLQKRQSSRANRLEISLSNKRRVVVNVACTPLILAGGAFSGAVLVLRDETRLNTLEKTLRGRRQLHSMIGKSSKMQDVFALIEDLADVPSTVLVTGESGTGKELVAEALHFMGDRREGPLVKVNCAALTDTLLESELFGHVRGAFTGAVQAREGRFKKADGGTIFLDEIGDISPGMQTRLLRVLQEKQFERVGDSTPIDVDVRVVTATNQDLQMKVRQGQFREDLYYRLKVVTVELPPLRERLDDIPLFVEHFRKLLNAELNRSVEEISQPVIDLFMAYSWPGNVRELKHVIEHAMIRCRQAVLNREHLPRELREKSTRLPASDGSEQDLICDALRRAGGNRSKAAKLLGIDRKTLYRKLDKFSIVVDDVTDC